MKPFGRGVVCLPNSVAPRLPEAIDISELRHDPVTGVSTVIEPDRAFRPSDFRRTPEEVEDSAGCPFCAGHEAETPAKRLELCLPGEASWTVRVFANRFPALTAADDEDWARALDAPWPYAGTTGFGMHEVIVETPVHDQALADFSPAHAALVVDAYADRIRTWREDGRFASALLFRNAGRAAGASLSHPHAQIIALPRVPEAIVRELGNFSQVASERGRCVLCEAMRADDAEQRIVFDDGTTVVHSPWAAPVPYAMRVAPRTCAPTLADASAEQRASFGNALVAAAHAIRGVFDDVAFNVVVHDAPYSAQHAGLPYHWHADVVPRTSQLAGFEWGSGVFLNVVDPDVAAVALRAGLSRV
jgi:UDPglucose--hexose-1-phosphate uridylyltransferase